MGCEAETGVSMSDSASEYTTYEIAATGRVQGVGFRAHTRQQAQQRGITGWVRNEGHDRLRAVIQHHDGAQLEKMLSWLAAGPPAARVDNLDVEKLPESGRYSAFEVRSSR